MFYMRKNGMRIDAIREQIAAWKDAGQIDDVEEACLLAPLVYQACYRSNTSGVFKGFHTFPTKGFCLQPLLKPKTVFSH